MELNEMPEAAGEYEAIVIGSGFAGAVTACRLSETERRRVLLLERGQRYQADDFPVYPQLGAMGDEGGGAPDLSNVLWRVGHGLWDLRDLGDVAVAQAAGYGGGSLVYANVHLRAPPELFDEDWPEVYRGGALGPYYDLAAFMLQVEPLPEQWRALPKSRQFARAAERLGRRAFFPPLAVNFHLEGKNPFGVEQHPCDKRGDCCFGCGRRAKNTLDLNYLALAEKQGVTVETLAEALVIERVGGPGSDEKSGARYGVSYKSHVYDQVRLARAPAVFLCAGAVNSTELLLRSRAAGTLPDVGSEPGAGYFTNADTLAVAFGCDELHETDRGPTITAALLHDGAPHDGDALARWRLRFRDGRAEPRSRSRIIGGSSGASGVLADPSILHSGAWHAGSATGALVLSQVRGSFEAGEELEIDGARFAIADSRARKWRHWLLVEDGGIPEQLEPLLGVFRSPLWLRRNRFAEQPVDPLSVLWECFRALAGAPAVAFWHAGPGTASPAPGAAGAADAGGPHLLPYAALPVSSLSELSASLPRGALDVPALRNELLWGWSWLPEQLRDALELDRSELLDGFAASAEWMVSEFLDTAAEQIEAQYTFEETLERLNFRGGLDVSGVSELQLGRQVLRLAVQLAFGSEASLARAAASKLLDFVIPDPRSGSTRIFDVLRWAMDYRLSDGRNGLLLAMGRDSLPGEISLDVEGEPASGSTIVGEGSGAEAIVLRASAKGELVLAKRRGRFRRGDRLVCGGRSLGVAYSDEADLHVEPAAGDAGDGSVGGTAEKLRLCVLRFGPDRDGPADEKEVHDALACPAKARLRVRLPHLLDTPERSTQERLLRDLARTWHGELRLNPSWSFLGRQFSVHSQGGCPMGSVTDETGEVDGCPGLYVMDAAAFPTSVGVNPSATILAIAEYKVERWIRRKQPEWRASQYDEAQKWAEERRNQLDPWPAAEARSLEPRSQPIGLAFREVMKGDLKEPEEPITTDLHATIPDLARFLEQHRRGRPEQITMWGHVELGDRRLDVLPGSHMILFAGHGGAQGRTIKYELLLQERWSGAASRLKGKKNLRDDQGRFDIWEDSTNLSFRLHTLGRADRSGVLRLPADAFFETQLPSFKVTGTTDRARQSWALAAFGRFFFGHLVDVYVPELDQVVDVVKRLVERSHA